MTPAQRRALANHRRRAEDNGLVRVEVSVPAAKAQLIRELAAALRADPDAEVSVVAGASSAERNSLWDVMSALPDVSAPEFDEAFETRRVPWTFREEVL